MKAIFLVILLLSQFSLAKGKYKPVVIEETKPESSKPSEPSAKKYAETVKSLLKQDLKSIDTHLSIEGSLRWLFVVVNYNEWNGFSTESRRKMVELMLRHMKKNYPGKGLKVSVGVDADQPLAEGDWSQFSDNPDVKLIGE